MLTNLMMNIIAKPDFISYKYCDRDNFVLRHLVDRKGLPETSWTLESADEYRGAVSAGSVPIFEQITPEELKKLLCEKGSR